jgi:glycosyltransferase involved in cell wall biosynthesis
MNTPRRPGHVDRVDRPRVGFVMEQVLGHVTHYRTLRGVLEQEPSISPHWVEVTYQGDGWLEHLPALPSSASGTLRGIQQVRQGLRGVRPDALFFHTHKPAVFQWDLLARVPTVLSLDVTPAQYDALGEYYEHQPDGETAVGHFKWWINQRTFGLARRVVAWSNWVKQSLTDDYGVPDEKIQVIPPGVALDFWPQPPGPRVLRAVPRVLFVGGDFQRKGGQLLLDWYRTKGRGQCELDLVTRSPIDSETGVRVHRDIQGNSLEARQLFFDADLFVLPSLGECFGIASVEAMAAGLPVITTRVGGAEDIVDDGQTGFLIPPNDPFALARALEHLLTNPTRRRDMGRRGRERAERTFDAVANARRLLACLEEVFPARAALVGRPATPSG